MTGGGHANIRFLSDSCLAKNLSIINSEYADVILIDVGAKY